LVKPILIFPPPLANFTTSNKDLAGIKRLISESRLRGFFKGSSFRDSLKPSVETKRILSVEKVHKIAVKTGRESSVAAAKAI